MAENLTSGRSFLDLKPSEPQLPVVVNGNLTGVLENDSCVPLKETYVQGVSVLPALIALENLGFLVAVVVNRNKLKHNNVYRYVASALVANFVTCVLGFYHFVNYYYGFEPVQPNHWWALRKGELPVSDCVCLVEGGRKFSKKYCLKHPTLWAFVVL